MEESEEDFEGLSNLMSTATAVKKKFERSVMDIDSGWEAN